MRSMIWGVVLLSACNTTSGDQLGAAKDGESWYDPIDHGQMVFGVSDVATFSDEALFHAWTFELTGEADVTLETSPQSLNVDTVMYLYAREPGSDSWGAYVAKNDDHAGGLGSRLQDELSAGEYLVQIKAAKSAIVGDFSMLGSCAGDGCPTDAGTCEDDSVRPLPDEQTFTEACNDFVAEQFLTPLSSRKSLVVTEDERCTYGDDRVAQAVEYYIGHYEEWGVWGDIEAAWSPESPRFNVAVGDHGDAGGWVKLDLGGDEDTIVFYFDVEGALVGYTHYEQSSSSRWTCELPGAALDEPDPECLYVAQQTMVHDDQTWPVSATSPGGELPMLVEETVAMFREEHSLTDETVTLSYETWTGEWGQNAAAVTMSALSWEETWIVGDDSGYLTVVARDTGDGLQFECRW